MDPATFALLLPIEEPTPRPQGLFEGLLKGHIEILASDAEESPDKYDERALPLIQAVVEGRKHRGELTDDERDLLDRATLDFATYVPPKKKTSPTTPPTARRARADDDDDEEHGIPIPGVEVPVTDTPPYWWLK